MYIRVPIIFLLLRKFCYMFSKTVNWYTFIYKSNVYGLNKISVLFGIQKSSNIQRLRTVVWGPFHSFVLALRPFSLNCHNKSTNKLQFERRFTTWKNMVEICAENFLKVLHILLNARKVGAKFWMFLSIYILSLIFLKKRVVCQAKFWTNL